MIPRCFVTKPYSPTSLIPLWLSLDKRTVSSHLSLREGSGKTTNGEAFARWRRDPDENGRILDLDWLSRSLFTDWPDRDRSCTKILQIKSIVRATPFRNLETSENTASVDALLKPLLCATPSRKASKSLNEFKHQRAELPLNLNPDAE